MRQLWFLGLCFTVVACSESAPADGAVRVVVTYGSYVPVCLRITATDGQQAHTEQIDLTQAKILDPDKEPLKVRVAVSRGPGWGRALMISVASMDAVEEDTRCSGNVIETLSTPEPIVVPLKDFATFAATLQARDDDGDKHVWKTQDVAGTDCDDTKATIHPGVPESCGGKVDYDCDGHPGCADPECLNQACDDGNACTDNDTCETTAGAEPQCRGDPKTCQPPDLVCYSSESACNPDTGECLLTHKAEGTACEDGNRCTVQDQCSADARCEGTPKQCNAPPKSSCYENPGTCDSATGDCFYKPQGPEASCNDSNACTENDKCDGSGGCKGDMLADCIPSNECHIAERPSCPSRNDCIERVDPSKEGKPCTDGSKIGSCRADGVCSVFRFRPSNFDPGLIEAQDRSQDVRISCTAPGHPVVFDSTSLGWTVPPECTLSAMPVAQVISQGDGRIVVLPMQSLTLQTGSALKLKGSWPVILAVYGDATLDGAVLADADWEVPGAGGNSQGCGTQKGGNGSFASMAGRGSGGGGGAFGQFGASGGKATSGSNGGSAGSRVSSTLDPLVGGCQGGTGGARSGTGNGGAGGAGGGALQLAVAGTLKVNHWISVSGGGGRGGKGSSSNGENAEGGGGGGSGGGLLLEAARLQLTPLTRIVANGGSGAEGGDSNDNKKGADGIDGALDSGNAAPGGDGGGVGAPGGRGGAEGDSAEPGIDGVTNGGAGGGGGGVGVIVLRAYEGCQIPMSCSSTDGNGCDISPKVTPICGP